jgi:hypothetical protein
LLKVLSLVRKFFNNGVFNEIYDNVIECEYKLLFRPFGFIVPKNFNIIWLSNLSTFFLYPETSFNYLEDSMVQSDFFTNDIVIYFIENSIIKEFSNQ